MSMQRFADLMDCRYTEPNGKVCVPRALLPHVWRSGPRLGTRGADGWIALAPSIAACSRKADGEKVDPTLYRMSRDYVGDTAETVALLWPDHPELADGLSLDGVVTAVSHASPAELPGVIGALLDRLDARGRWALLKLIGGAPRVGVLSNT